MTQIWNVSNKNTNIALSGGSLIATSSLVGNYAGGGATTAYSAGKFYWETLLTFASIAGAGIINTSETAWPDGEYIGANANMLGYHSNGQVYSNGLQTTFATFTSPTLICTALDLGAAKIWWRPGATANWNNDVIGNQDPANNIGGWALPALLISGGTGMMPAFVVHDNGDTAVAGFASSSWTGAAPTNFLAFDPISELARAETGAVVDAAAAGYLLSASISEFA